MPILIGGSNFYKHMIDFSNDYSQIHSDIIPLSSEEIADKEKELKANAKVVPIILGICTIITMLFLAYLMRDKFKDFKYYEYLLFIGAGFAFFGFSYLVGLLVTKYDNHNWKKDKVNGKIKLTTVIIGSDKTKYGEYLIFADPNKNEKMRVKVSTKVYKEFKVGTKVTVLYLEHSKKTLDIIEC